MKSFDSFKNELSSELVESWNQEIKAKLLTDIDRESSEDPHAQLASFIASYSYQMSLKMLEKYHEWSSQ